jgi:uncharacterized RDD family membrane protein YckC
MALDTVRSVETPEGISLALRPAGPVARSLAFLLDTLIRILVVICGITAMNFLGVFGNMTATLLVFGVEWFYPVVFELALAGATPGKRALGLQVVMDSGLPVTPAASITRNLLRAADFLPFFYGFGIVAMLLGRDFKRLGDLAGGTLVVHVQPVALAGVLPDAAPLRPARPLSARQQVAVVAWAGRAATLTPERLAELAWLAQPAFPAPPAAGATGDSGALLGVAQWLLGRREDAAS